MKKRVIFKGVGTALITPFCDGEIDYEALDLLIERQLAAKTDALVIGGTTGEAATLSDRERYELYRHSIDRVAGRCPVILGTGTNDTRVAIRHTQTAEELGADGALVVTPYYNKGTEQGLCDHYAAIAEAVGLPIILYNVPSRTGVSIPVSQLEKLARIENIVGIKEASDSADRLVKISALGEELPLYAGNDSQTYTALALGGVGVISVVSNLYPERVMKICESYLAGRADEARVAQTELLPLIDAMFVETNPAPIKYAMSRLGLCREDMRLPMSPVCDATRNIIDRAMSLM